MIDQSSAPQQPMPTGGMNGQPPQQMGVLPEIQAQQLKDQIIQILRNDKERCYRIQIASDSMVALDQAQEKKDGVDYMQSVGSFFSQMKGLIEEYPPLAQFAVELTKDVGRLYRGSKDTEALYQKALMDVAQIVQQKMSQASTPPPPPDPTLQIAQMDNQTKMQLGQMDNQIKQQQAQAKMQDDQLTTQATIRDIDTKAQIDASRHQLEQWRAQQDVALRQRELEIKANAVDVDLLKVQSTVNLEQANLDIIQEQGRLAALIDTQRLHIESLKAHISAKDIETRDRQVDNALEIAKMKPPTPRMPKE